MIELHIHGHHKTVRIEAESRGDGAWIEGTESVGPQRAILYVIPRQARQIAKKLGKWAEERGEG